MKLDISIANQLYKICDTCDFDVNIVCGRKCVDGKSIIGVMEMCGHIVTLAPVTPDEYSWEMFFHRVQEIGAYKEDIY